MVKNEDEELLDIREPIIVGVIVYPKAFKVQHRPLNPLQAVPPNWNHMVQSGTSRRAVAELKVRLRKRHDAV